MLFYIGLAVWILGWLISSIFIIIDETKYKKVPVYELIAISIVIFFTWPILALQYEVGRKPYGD